MYIHMYACKCTNEITIVEFKGSEYLSLQVFHKKKVPNNFLVIETILQVYQATIKIHFFK